LRQDILGFARESFTLGAAGRLSREKGFAFLLEALAGLVTEGHDLRLVILGEGGLRQALEQQVKALGLGERVLLPGYVADAGRYLPSFDLFVLPSLTEGLPMVLLEAMSVGLPTVASRVGGIPVVLDQGRAGLLVEPRDVDSLKAGIRAIIKDPCGADQRSSVASDRVRTVYSSPAMARHYFDVYRQLVPEAAANVAEMGGIAP
jgi:glycosyltransferase involved in cell wall biosynthesis